MPSSESSMLPAEEAWERIRTFVTDLEGAIADRTEPWRYGTAYFNATYPMKYAFNFLRYEIEEGPAEAAELIAAADEVQGAAGLSHRRVNWFGHVPGLAEGFREQGWEASAIVGMMHDGIVRERGGLDVEEVDLDEMLPVMYEWNLSEESYPPEVAEQLAASRKALENATDITFLVARIDGKIAGWCELYLGDGIAQIEDVMTFSAYRNRGVASSVVNEALSRAYASGSGLAFLLADEDDWPKSLYARLGFEPAGHIYETTLHPPGFSADLAR